MHTRDVVEGTKVREHSSWIDALGIVLEGVMANSENRKGLVRLLNLDSGFYMSIWAAAVALQKIMIWSTFVGILTNAYWDIDFQRKCEESIAQHFPIPSWAVYFYSKLYRYRILRPFFQDPDFCEAIEQMQRELKAWSDALASVDPDQLLQQARSDIANGDVELEIRDAMVLFDGTQAERYLSAAHWMTEVCEKTGVKMKRMQVKSSTKFEIRVLTDRLNKLEEEACGLAVQLNGSVPEVKRFIQPI